MSEDKQSQNLGDQIIHAVDDILASGNFDKLNSVVSDTVYKALDEAQRQFSNAATKEERVTAFGKADVSGVKQQAKSLRPSRKMLPRARLRRVGSVSGALLQVLGTIGTGLFGLLFVLAAAGGHYYTGRCLFFLLVSIWMLSSGKQKRRRLIRADRYLYVMQGKSYMNIADLAALTNMTQKQVRSDVRQMIKLGIFPEGHLDRQEKCLMLNDTAYMEYLELEKQRKALAKEERERKKLEAKRQDTEKKQADNTVVQENTENGQEAQKRAEDDLVCDDQELAAMIEEGDRCIRQLRNLNDAIEGEVISAKLFQLEGLLKEIFEQVEEHPEQMSEMHKFMDYYLPTTLKLVQAYEEFDDVSVPGEDILSAKAEIEKTLDTINMAFAELLNRLFRDRAFDASTDAQVLKTMLAREGLTREPIFAGNTDGSANACDGQQERR